MTAQLTLPVIARIAVMTLSREAALSPAIATVTKEVK